MKTRSRQPGMVHSRQDRSGHGRTVRTGSEQIRANHSFHLGQGSSEPPEQHRAIRFRPGQQRTDRSEAARRVQSSSVPSGHGRTARSSLRTKQGRASQFNPILFRHARVIATRFNSMQKRSRQADLVPATQAKTGRTRQDAAAQSSEGQGKATNPNTQIK